MYMHTGPADGNPRLSIVRKSDKVPDLQTTRSPHGDTQGSPIWMVVIMILVGSVMAGVGYYLFYKRLRRLRLAGKRPGYIRTRFLKQKWEAWKPKAKYTNTNRNTGNSEAVGFVSRNSSVRSVMTLPAYSQKPLETEEVIGREGERDGIDTVIDLPETLQEQEERRESEMESLYQIRQTRRREIGERDERRQEIREARARGDLTRLDELRREAIARRDQNNLTNPEDNTGSNLNVTAEMMMAEHTTRGRERRISSVSYGALGQVRHDGSRVRSDSRNSESGLLGAAEPMGQHTRNGSEVTLLTLGGLPNPQYRDRSNSAATSASASSFEDASSPSDHTRPGTAGTAQSQLPAGSMLEADAEETDIGNERMVISEVNTDSPRPPQYDGHHWGDAPVYTESPHVTRANSTATTRTRTDTLSILPPSIHIETPTVPNTPVVGTSSPIVQTSVG